MDITWKHERKRRKHLFTGVLKDASYAVDVDAEVYGYLRDAGYDEQTMPLVLTRVTTAVNKDVWKRMQMQWQYRRMPEASVYQLEVRFATDAEAIAFAFAHGISFIS
ncbi:hypothetical protein [Burkholderia gladioli]|uniref:hypothetical protein n=1 Tax=Burkholderia gladioli TaxID=28095 RepID=UPI001641F8AB|nr:hypothetical protein [Burkholderia gladioli]